MTLREKQSLFMLNVASFIHYVHSNGFTCTFGEAYRTPEQAEIYAKSGKGIKDSLHCKRLALDFNLYDVSGTYLTDSKDYEKFGIYWESLHEFNRWGGRFKKLVDGNHIEMQDL